MKRVIPHTRGFTFIELMVAFTLFSIVATSVYYTFWTGLRVWKRMDAAIERTQRVRAFIDSIETDLQNAIPFFCFQNAWKAHEIIFPCVTDISSGDRLDREIIIVRYYYDIQTGMVKMSRAGKDKGFNTEGRVVPEKIHLSGVEGMTFSYAYVTGIDKDKFEWRDTWEFADKMPQGLKIKVKFFDTEANMGTTVERLVFLPTGEMGTTE